MGLAILDLNEQISLDYTGVMEKYYSLVGLENVTGKRNSLAEKELMPTNLWFLNEIFVGSICMMKVLTISSHFCG